MKRCNKLLTVLFAAIGAALLFGCSNQSEGERCSKLTGDDDCEPGLSCQLIGSLELCCPTSRAPSVPECIPGSNLPDAGTDAAEEAAAADAATDSIDASEEGSGL